MSNIAEGFDSRTDKLFADFLGRAKASAGEVQCQLFIALDRHYVGRCQFDRCLDLTDKVSRQIFNLMKAISRNG